MTTCFLDFDHTLFQTDQFFYADVRQAFSRFPIDNQLWQESYDAVWSTGYSLAKHIAELNRRSNQPLPYAEMAQILTDQFTDLSRYVFPDVLPFLKAAKLSKEKGEVKLVLLSFGNPEWQDYKVKASGLNDYFDEVVIAEAEQQKVTAISDRQSETMLMVDNNPAELDSIKDQLPSVKTYRINRVPAEAEHSTDPAYSEARKYLAQPSRYQHHDCRSLLEINL